MTRYTDYIDINVKGHIESSKQGLLIGSLSTMPVASQSYVGQTIVYTGTTTQSYVKDRSYRCEEVSTGVYSWVDCTPAQELNLSQNTALVSDQNGNIVSSSVTSTELGTLSGISGNIQDSLNGIGTQLNGKQPTLTQANAGANISITGSGQNVVISGASQVGTSWGNIGGDISTQVDLNNTFQKKDVGTANRVIVSDQNGAISTSSISQTELGYLDNATSNIQTQLNNLDTNKVAQNASIQGGTHTKISYDQKGLVTGGQDLSQADIPDLSSTYQPVGDYATNTSLSGEVSARQTADQGLQDQIDALTSKSDVVDVVQTYADLQAYDTSQLGNNDIVKVLDDSTHGDQESYYRWVITAGAGAWSYIGSLSATYTKAETDALLVGKMSTSMNNASLGSANEGKYLKVTQVGGITFDTPDMASKADADLGNVNVGSTNANKYIQVSSTGALQYSNVDMSSKANTSLDNINVGTTNSGKFAKVTSTGAFEYVSQEASIANNKPNPPTTTAVYSKLNHASLFLQNNSTGVSDITLSSYNYATAQSGSNTLFVSKKDLTNTNVGDSNAGKYLQVTAQGQIGYSTPPDTKYSAGDGLVLTGTVFTPNVGFTTSGKDYQVEVDATSKGLFVNVPWTDTVTTATTTGSGNAVTQISQSNGQLSVTKGTTFATAQELSTGLSGKVSNATGTSTIVYGYNGSANTNYSLSSSATQNTVAYRGTGGVLNVGTPTQSTHATTKTYVDTALGGKQANMTFQDISLTESD